MTKIRKKNISLSVYYKYLKKTFFFNIFLAITLVVLFNLNFINKKKSELYTYLNIDPTIYRSFDLNHEKHLYEINDLFEENLNYISSLTDNENERIKISASRISFKSLRFFKIRSLVRTKKFNENLFEKNLSEIVSLTEKDYRKILINNISTLNNYDQLATKIIKNALDDLNFSEHSLTMDYTKYLNNSVSKKLLLKGHQQLLNKTKIIDYSYVILTSKPKIILTSIVIFIFSIITFNFILGIYIIGKEKL
tara:strand:- start:32 stop:784 length:753 start_codon:yes stop_codon:yes gene_type:complete